VFVIGAVLLSVWLKLELERDMVVSAVRATIQLLIVGYILNAVFHAERLIFVLLMVALMIAVATHNASKRGKGLSGVWWRVLAAIAVTEVLTQGFLVLIRVIPPTPRYLIPVSGMLIGNAMIVAGLALNRLQSEAHSHRQEIVAVLALGGTPKQAVMPYLKQALRASMLPTIDSTKTMGLVQLPGMMTGQIIAGANPVEAVRYQLLIVFMIIASAAITSIVLGFLTYPRLFNAYDQLIDMEP
jgi:putative ABC transport system permease protein